MYLGSPAELEREEREKEKEKESPESPEELQSTSFACLGIKRGQALGILVLRTHSLTSSSSRSNSLGSFRGSTLRGARCIRFWSGTLSSRSGEGTNLEHSITARESGTEVACSTCCSMSRRNFVICSYHIGQFNWGTLLVNCAFSFHHHPRLLVAAQKRCRGFSKDIRALTIVERNTCIQSVEPPT